MAYNVSMEELKSFYGIDRPLFARLTTELGHDRNQAMQVMAFWLLLEEIGYPSIISALRNLPAVTVNAVYNEAVICLAAVESENPPVATCDDIPITYHSLLNSEVSLLFLHENRDFVLDGITKTLTEVCTMVFEDAGLDLAQDDDSDQGNVDPSLDPIVRQFHNFHLGSGSRDGSNEGKMVVQGTPTPTNLIMPNIPFICYGLHPAFRPLLHFEGIGPVPMQGQPMVPLFYPVFGPLGAGLPEEDFEPQGPSMNFEIGEPSGRTKPPEERSMFMTFSRGYPVSEEELGAYLVRLYGEVVETIQMANVPPHAQPLWAIVVFHSPTTVDDILSGEDRVRFVIKRIRPKGGMNISLGSADAGVFVLSSYCYL